MATHEVPVHVRRTLLCRAADADADADADAAAGRLRSAQVRLCLLCAATGGLVLLSTSEFLVTFFPIGWSFICARRYSMAGRTKGVSHVTIK
jgi:hypothetical protein